MNINYIVEKYNFKHRILIHEQFYLLVKLNEDKVVPNQMDVGDTIYLYMNTYIELDSDVGVLMCNIELGNI